jgi:hypothetical protein
MRVRRWSALAAVFTALAALAGCSGGSSGSFATVSGVVTHNATPVNGAKVTFYSTVAAGGKQAGSYSATTDSSGRYLIAAVGKDPGIPPGLYKVTITKLEVKGKNLPEDYDAGQIEASGAARNLLPRDYENLNTTKLSVTLEPGKNEDKNFELKGKPSTTGPFETP